MAYLFVDESKYSLESRLAGSSTKILLKGFNDRLSEMAAELNSAIVGRVHSYGVTYYPAKVKKNKAFMCLDIRRNYLTLKFFIGKGNIVGLAKGTWHAGQDMCGSAPVRLKYEKEIREVLAFARDSLKITMQQYQ